MSKWFKSLPEWQRWTVVTLTVPLLPVIIAAYVLFAVVGAGILAPLYDLWHGPYETKSKLGERHA